MRKAGIRCVVLFQWALAAAAAPPETTSPPPKSPADFKLVMTLFGVQKDPVKKVDLVFRDGKVFRFDALAPFEVMVFDPRARKLELFDLDRKLRTELRLSRLDAFQKNLHDAVADASTKRESQGGKANEVAAAMSRDLIEPRYSAEYDPRTHSVRLKNPSVDFEGRGQVEGDRARLDLVAQALSAFMKLESMRDPTAVPPFTRLEALRVMTAEHQLMPTEMTYIYRLAGPPRKHRWMFDLEPSLTEREVKAVSLIETMSERYRSERFERYEKREKR